MLVCSSYAQEYQKNIFGVRAGMNIANVNAKMLGLDLDELVDLDSKVHFNAGISYERLLLNKAPLYLETGLYYTNKGFKVGYDDESLARCNIGYLQLPLMVNYKFNIKDVVTIAPSAGIYYSFGVTGKIKESYDDEYLGDMSYSASVFEGNYIKRSDLGYKLGVSVAWKNIVLGFSYEGGFLNLLNVDNIVGDLVGDFYNYDYDYDYDDDFGFNIDADALGIKAHNSNFVISLGYNF